MKLDYRRYDLKLLHPFTISRSSRDTVPVVIIEFEKDGITAFGEASPNARYGETADSVQDFLSRIDVTNLSDPFQLERIGDYLDFLAPGNSSAKCAVDIAMHDWICKKRDIPLYRFYGADRDKAPVSSFTVGIDEPDMIVRKVEEASNYPVLKIKLGSANDEEIIKAVRSVTNKPLRVDANEGWKSKEDALASIHWLSTQNVEFVEQPMPAGQIDDARWLRGKVKLPIIADEALSQHSVAELSTAYDGINIKLQKNGGLLKARKLVREARETGMKVMLGCMIETSVGIAAAAHFSPLVDWADLDGNRLISNDPFTGVPNEDGELVLSDEPGLGVRPL
jgi:L-alanine-DL-glutamate epimerase-like enolase superfamily enzyme